MRLPAGERAVVPRAKLERYLLSTSHRSGASKARFFRRFGFRNSDDLEAALLEVARDGEVTADMETRFGRKYVVDGLLETPRGIQPMLRTVWIIEHGTEAPRFVTAYPR